MSSVPTRHRRQGEIKITRARKMAKSGGFSGLALNQGAVDICGMFFGLAGKEPYVTWRVNGAP